MNDFYRFVYDLIGLLQKNSTTLDWNGDDEVLYITLDNPRFNKQMYITYHFDCNRVHCHYYINGKLAGNYHLDDLSDDQHIFVFDLFKLFSRTFRTVF